MPSPARSIPSRKSKKEGGKERDLLDDFIGIKDPLVQVPSASAFMN